MNTITCRRYTMIGFNEILDACQESIFKDLHTYGMMDRFSFKKTDNKKPFYHHIILTICNTIIENKSKNKIIIIFNEDDLDSSMLCTLTELHLCKKFFYNFIKKIRNILPINVLDYSRSFTEIPAIVEKKNGRYKELIKLIEALLSKDKVSFEFDKIKNFTKRYELTYLNKDFFNRIKTKNLVFM